MPNIDTIAAAAYGELVSDSTLAALATVYKGQKRPSSAASPALTVDVRRLDTGEGRGMWICDIVVTAYVGLLANRMADYACHGAISEAVRRVLADRTLALGNAQALPLIEGASTAPEWDRNHDSESWQENTFGLVFMDFS